MTTLIRYRYACGCGRTALEPGNTAGSSSRPQVVNVAADCADCKGRPVQTVQPGGRHFDDGTGQTRTARDPRTGLYYSVAHEQHGRRHIPHCDDPAHQDWRLA